MAALRPQASVDALASFTMTGRARKVIAYRYSGQGTIAVLLIRSGSFLTAISMCQTARAIGVACY